MPTPRDWTEQLPARRHAARGQLSAELGQLADPSCEDCDGSGVTAAGDVCGCVDW